MTSFAAHESLRPSSRHSPARNYRLLAEWPGRTEARFTTFRGALPASIDLESILIASIPRDPASIRHSSRRVVIAALFALKARYARARNFAFARE